MTEQYQTEDINGQPSPLSLTMQTSSGFAAGLVDNAAIFFTPGAGLDVAIVGNGLSLARSNPSVGTIVSITALGVFRVDFTTQDLSSSGEPVNIVLNATQVPISTANSYPSPDYFTLPNILAVNALVFVPFQTIYLGATFRITPEDLENVPFGGPNIRLSAPTAAIPALFSPLTRLTVTRVSL